MSASDVVTLRGGLTLPVDAIRLAFDLEHRGLTLTIAEGDVLVVGPRERLTDDDRVLIRRWKRQLMAIVTYDANAHEGVQ